MVSFLVFNTFFDAVKYFGNFGICLQQRVTPIFVSGLVLLFLVARDVCCCVLTLVCVLINCS